jgi:RNA polymerase sigma-70 factor (ECF subfamily)
VAFPSTDPGLIRQLKPPADPAAWGRFVAIYRPAIVAVARQRGLALADADDVVQEVFTAVAGAVHRFDPDREDGASSAPRARFSTWLTRIADRKTIDALRRSRVRPASGHAFDAVAARDTDSRLLRFEVRRRLFLTAAADPRTR